MLKQFIRFTIILFAISLITFLLTYLSPSDPVNSAFISSGYIQSEEIIEQTRAELGLDRPFIIQYLDWLKSCLTGDFGISYSTGLPVSEMLLSRLPATISLALLALLFMIILAVPMGIVSALYPNNPIDYLMRFLSFIAISIPNFTMGIVLLYFFAYKFNFFNVIYVNTSFESMILPAFTLAFTLSGKYARQVRTAILEELNEEYIFGAKARGLHGFTILFCHVLPNAIMPLITILGLSFASLLGGTAVIEIIFSYKGVGTLAINAINSADYPVIQAFMLWITFIYLSLNLIVDISYKTLDPRLKKRRS